MLFSSVTIKNFSKYNNSPFWTGHIIFLKEEWNRIVEIITVEIQRNNAQGSYILCDFCKYFTETPIQAYSQSENSNCQLAAWAYTIIIIVLTNGMLKLTVAGYGSRFQSKQNLFANIFCSITFLLSLSLQNKNEFIDFRVGWSITASTITTRKNIFLPKFFTRVIDWNCAVSHVRVIFISNSKVLQRH